MTDPRLERMAQALEEAHKVWQRATFSPETQGKHRAIDWDAYWRGLAQAALEVTS